MISQFWKNQAQIKSLYTDCMEPVLRKYHLTRMELDILLFLANNPLFNTARDIIETRHLTKSHVSLAVNTLVSKGYLAKSKSEHNRKTVHLSICPSSGEIIRDGQDAQKIFSSILFRDFTHEDYQQLLKLFKRINQNVEDYTKGGL
ncbi:MAG: MarR family transcriptional regulator [Lachnospiraceae bacterium]